MAARLKSSHHAGTTLVELMVSATIFLLLMSAIMSFYISGAKVNTQQNQRLEMVRRSLRLLDRLEVKLAYSRVIWLGSVTSEKDTKDNNRQASNADDAPPSEQTILFAPLSKAQRHPEEGAPWDSRVEKIYVTTKAEAGPQVFCSDGQGQTVLLGSLSPGETIELSQEEGCIKVKLALNFYQSGAATPEGQQYIQERTIPLHNYLHY